MERQRRIALASALAAAVAMTGCAAETNGGNATGGSGSSGTSVPGSSPGAAGTGTLTGGGTGLAGTGAGTTGAAGSVGSTGAAGTGGTLPVMTGAKACTVAAADAVIDDFESGLNGAMHACVHGYWYTYNDKSAGMQTPAASMFKPEMIADRPGSAFAAHSTAMGFSGDAMGHAFAAFGLDLDADSSTAKAVVDASGFKGITFQAKGTGTLRVELHTKASDPDFGCATKCYDFPYKTITLTAAWQAVTIPWADFAQDKFGTPETTDGKDLGSIQFASKAEKMAIAPYDMWLDDLKFMP
jgi:hypothetical protein